MMALMTATLAVASALHFGVTIFGIRDSFRDAAVPEAVIAGVLAGGLAAVVAPMRTARRVAIGATLFAVTGFLVGVRFTIFGDDPLRGGDVAYHVGGLVVL